MKRRVQKTRPTPLLTVLGVDPNRWADRWGIEPFSVACSGCGAIKTTTIPIARGSLRGLMAPKCPCGDESATYCLVRDPAVGDLLAEGFTLER